MLIGAWEAAGSPENVRCLLSAHGLPETVVQAGDPYQWQVELTVAKLKPLLPPEWGAEKRARVLAEMKPSSRCRASA